MRNHIVLVKSMRADVKMNVNLYKMLLYSFYNLHTIISGSFFGCETLTLLISGDRAEIFAHTTFHNIARSMQRSLQVEEGEWRREI